MKQTVVTFRQAKGQRKLAMLTAYDATVARLMDDHVDAVLVGDSLGMVMLGQPDTLSVTMDQMIHHCAAVSRGLTKPLLVCDMPFMSYHLSPQQACANAGRLVQDLAKREKFDLVLYEYFYASDRIDLTKRVIDLLDASSDARKK